MPEDAVPPPEPPWRGGPPWRGHAFQRGGFRPAWWPENGGRMDRRLAQRNLIGGLLAGGLALLAFGLAFAFAVVYITQ